MATKDINKRRQQWQNWYAKHKDDPKHKKRLKDFDCERRKVLCEWFEDLKSQMKCKVCKFSHPAALDFHHRNPSSKMYDVSVMPGRGMSKKKILAEMAKCDVLCANCHRIRHYNEKSRVQIPPDLLHVP